MAKGGRPRIELTTEQIELIERLAGFGLTQAQIADCLPMAERTLAERIRTGSDPRVSAAYASGRAKDAETLASRHRDIALGKLDNTPVAEQRKALEWRLERQHGFPAQMEVGVQSIHVQRSVVSASDPANRIKALTNGGNEGDGSDGTNGNGAGHA